MKFLPLILFWFAFAADAADWYVSTNGTGACTIGSPGNLTFEYFHPYLHYPEELVYQTSDSLDRMLGRKPGGRAA